MTHASVPHRRSAGSRVVETVVVVVIALAVAALVRAFVVQAFYIPSGSMENTLVPDDRIAVSKLGPLFGSIERGDVVVFRDPGGWLDSPTASTNPVRRFLEFVGVAPSSTEGDLVKRVIGVGGDHVVCCDKQGRITVNGVPLEEDYLYPGDVPSLEEFDVTVPIGSLWVMGDHRSASDDSRAQPKATRFVPEDDVIGRAVAVFWPIRRWELLRRPATFADVSDQSAGSG
jgi:signal peptidase I